VSLALLGIVNEFWGSTLRCDVYGYV